MIQFPDEAARCEEIRQELDFEIGFARRLLSFWIDVDKNRPIGKCTLDDDVLKLAVLLNVQSCVLFRAVIDLGERSDGFTANIASRSLFETTLALAFVLKPKLKIFASRLWDKARKSPKRDHHGQVRYEARIAKRAKHISGLTSKFRAHLYIAFLLISDENQAKRLSRIPGLKRQGKRELKAIPTGLLRAVERKLGKKWLYVLRNQPYTYCGLKVNKLAELIGGPFPRWYNTVYHEQSKIVHGVDAVRFFRADETGMSASWFSETREVSGAVRTAVAMFLSGLILFHQRADLGVVIGTALSGFHKEWVEKMKSEPD